MALNASTGAPESVPDESRGRDDDPAGSEAPDDGTPAWRFLIVGGAPRSGTTLLQNMLDSHPAIYGGPEFLHLRDVIHLRSRLRNSVHEGWITQYADEKELDEVFRRFVRELLDGAFPREGVQIFSEKSPQSAIVFEELVELFPDASFLLMVRDPRDVVASMLEVGERGRREGRTMQPFTRDVISAVNYLRECARAGTAGRDAAPSRVEIVRYEDLVTDPEGTSRGICSFLGLDWSSEMLRPGEKEHAGRDAIVDGVWYDEERFDSDPRTDSLGSWRERLRPAEKVAVSRALGSEDAYRELGYDLTDSDMTRGTHAMAFIRYGTARLIQRIARRLGALSDAVDSAGRGMIAARTGTPEERGSER